LFCHFQAVPAEIGEDARDKCGDSAEAAASSPKKRKKQKSCMTSTEEECLAQALNVIRRVPDDHDTFGEYVAMELRSLRYDKSRREMRKAIRQVIARIADAEDFNSVATCSTETEV
jgi:hypothetical protein